MLFLSYCSDILGYVVRFLKTVHKTLNFKPLYMSGRCNEGFPCTGTGKTLMARQIGKMLHAKEPKIVNGPGRHPRKMFVANQLSYSILSVLQRCSTSMSANQRQTSGN